MRVLPARWIAAALLSLILTIPATSQDGSDDGLRAMGAGLLRVEVPFEPTAFVSAGGKHLAYNLAAPNVGEPLVLQRVDANEARRRNLKHSSKNVHLAYELVLTNIGSAPLTLQRIEIADGKRRNAEPVVAYEGSELEALLAFPYQQPEIDGNRLQLKPTDRVVVNLFVFFQDRKLVPATLRHRVYTVDTVIEGAPIGTRHSRVPVLGPPLSAGDWLVSGGPGATGSAAYHRQNTFILNGTLEAARRYAIDWIKVENGKMQSDKLAGNASYYGYGQEVLAVADGVITTAVDGVPENVPGHVPPVQLSAPVCKLCGNHVVLELAPGQFATYMHLKPGSLRVATGDRVRRGQVLARVGNSGDSFLPHLHFHVATEPGMTGQGLPYLIERFSIVDPAGAPQLRTRELPLDGMLIDFGS